MNDALDLPALGREIIDANLYMVLGTADRDGRPWATPVYFAPVSYREFLWVSEPDAQHSRNIEARRQLSIVIFDSTAAINTGQAVYMSAEAEELTGDGAPEALAAYSRRAVSHGGREYAPEEVRAPAELRLYRAAAVDQYVLGEDDRVPATL